MNYWIKWSVLVVIAAAALVIAFILDPPVQAWMMAHQNAPVRAFMERLRSYGDWPAHVLLGLVLLGVARLRLNEKWMRIFLSMLIACALAGIVAYAIKVGVGRARPAIQLSETWRPSLSSKYQAFPSGHTASSTAFFAVLFFANWRIAVACLPIPLLIGFSRLYCGAHHLSDVVCAAIVGVLCAWLTARFVLKIDNLKS